MRSLKDKLYGHKLELNFQTLGITSVLRIDKFVCVGTLVNYSNGSDDNVKREFVLVFFVKWLALVQEELHRSLSCYGTSSTRKANN